MSNSAKETTIHFEIHKLSNSAYNPIVHNTYDGRYNIAGRMPRLQLVPESVVCRKYSEQFTIRIDVSDAMNVENLEFEIHYNTTLLDYANVTWNTWLTGTIALDEDNGVVTGSTSGTAISGNYALATITYSSAYYHIWKVESQVPGWKNDLIGEIFFEWANLSYPDTPDLHYLRGGSSQIDLGPEVAYKFSPIQGDVNNDGQVDVFDLRAIAYYYDVVSTDPDWPQASKYDLNGDGTIDILDLVLVAVNFAFSYP
jgi:hypothetical protein